MRFYKAEYLYGKIVSSVIMGIALMYGSMGHDSIEKS